MPSPQPLSLAALRMAAEARLKAQAKRAVAPHSAADANRLLHEIQVHQIELELQNEELVRSRHEVETGLARYTDLYDFAPVGYVTLDRAGQIAQSGLAAAGLLGTERAQLQGTRLAACIAPADLALFNACMASLFTGEPTQSCEVALDAAGPPLRIVRIVAIRGETGAESRLVIEDITASRQAEAARLTGAAKFAQLIDSVDGILWEADAATFQFTYVSSRAERLLGYPVARWTGEPAFWADHIHPDDRDQAVHFCATCTANKQDHDFEYRMLAADGSTVWLRDIVTVEVKDDGPIALGGVMADITKRKATEAALHRSEAETRRRLREIEQIYAYSPIGLFIFDREYRFERVNERMAEINGFPVAHHLGKTLEEIVPDLAGFLREAYRPIFERGEPVLNVGIHGKTPKDPELERDWIGNYFPLRSETGEVIGLIGAVLEITASKRAGIALRASEARLRAIIDHEPECVKVVAPDGRLEEVNPAGLRMLEADSPDQVLRRNIFPLIVQKHRDAFRALHEKVLRGESGELEFDLIGLKGTRRTLETHATPLRNGAGDITSLLGLTRDVTARKQAETKLRDQLIELQRWQRVTQGREERVQALKREVNALLRRSGEPERYRSVTP